MQIKKLMIKRFGQLVDREYDGNQPVMMIAARSTEEQQALCEVLMAVLFGFPPHRRAQGEYIPQPKHEQYSASVVIVTENGEYLIGRNFGEESLEVFHCHEKRLLSPATALMDLLYRESRNSKPVRF